MIERYFYSFIFPHEYICPFLFPVLLPTLFLSSATNEGAFSLFFFFIIWARYTDGASILLKSKLMVPIRKTWNLSHRVRGIWMEWVVFPVMFIATGYCYKTINSHLCRWNGQIFITFPPLQKVSNTTSGYQICAFAVLAVIVPLFKP